MKTLTILTAAALLLAAALPASAQQKMNYQGRVTDAAGVAVPGPAATLTFNIYTAATGGTPVWGPFSVNADLIDGRFNVLLGPNDTAGTPRSILTAFSGSADRYIHVTVGSNAALPRQLITAAPMALHADRATHATTADTAANFTSLVLKTDETNLRVGIGTASPAEKLHINGGNLFIDNPSSNPVIAIGTSTDRVDRHAAFIEREALR